MGTFGCLALEYASTGNLTEKSNAYSFNVVLLELITGRKPVDTSQTSGEESLVEWARPLLARALNVLVTGDLADPRLDNNFDEIEMLRMIEDAAACVQHSASRRPSMSQIVRALDSVHELADLSNGMKPGQSEVVEPGARSGHVRMFQRIALGIEDYGTDFFDQSQRSWNPL